MKISQLAAELFHVGKRTSRQTDMKNSRFSQFCECAQI